MLEACDLACVRGDETLFEGLSFAAGPGEALWIEGENGTGKTSRRASLVRHAVPRGA